MNREPSKTAFPMSIPFAQQSQRVSLSCMGDVTEAGPEKRMAREACDGNECAGSFDVSLPQRTLSISQTLCRSSGRRLAQLAITAQKMTGPK